MIKNAFVVVLLVSFLLFTHAFAEGQLVITDMAGRQLKVPKKIERIVALHASLRYVTYLQAFDKVVGVEGVEKQRVTKGNQAEGKPYWLTIADKVEKIPAVGEGGPGKLPDFERLISVKPDIVLVFEPELAEAIQRKTGIPTIVISYAGTQGFKMEEIQRTFSFMGKLLGKEERAKELNDYIDRLIADLQKRTASSNRPSVYIGAISARGSHGITSTESKYPPLQWLNVNNVVDEINREGHIFVDREKLLVWNPDFMFIDTGGLPLVEEDYLKHKDFYRQLKAVKGGNVFTVFSYNFYRTNLEILMANSYFIGKTIYPKEFQDIVVEEKAREIFKMFLCRDVLDSIKEVYKGYAKVRFTESGISLH